MIFNREPLGLYGYFKDLLSSEVNVGNQTESDEKDYDDADDNLDRN